MRKGIRMSFEESYMVDVCYQVIRGDLSVKEAALKINKSYRQTLRIVERVRVKGLFGIKHGNTGKSPINKIDDKLKQKVMEVYKRDYFDYNMVHFLEELKKEHHIEVAYETFRLWAHESGHVKRKHTKRKKRHSLRPRMPRSGMMIQMDGSHHDWFGNNIKPVLVGCIDDATSECMYAEFFPAEDKIAVLTVMQKLLEKHGVPELLYVDQAAAHGKAGFFRKFEGWQDHITDLERTLLKYGCRMLFATSAQGKGRIERLWNTFQDRLIPELRRQKIKNIPRANDYLWNHFIPYHNQKFGISALNPDTAWRKLSDFEQKNLDKNFYMQEFRKILSGEVISMKGIKYLLEHPYEFSLEGMHVEIRTYLDGSQKLYYADRDIQLVGERIILRAA